MKKRMTDMKRRDFINAAALTAGGVMLGGASQLEAQQNGLAGEQGATPPTPKPGWPSRVAKVEILFTLHTPRCRTFRSRATVFSQPNYSSMRFLFF